MANSRVNFVLTPRANFRERRPHVTSREAKVSELMIKDKFGHV